jgi:hypothetical protein
MTLFPLFIITFLIVLGTATIYQGTLVAGNSKGNKVSETIFAGNKYFIKLADSEEIISQSLWPQPVSGAGLNTDRICPPTPNRIWSQLQETL